MRKCILCFNTTDERRRRCHSCNTKIRRYRNKQAAVKLLGGKCSRCGWSGEQAAFQFHHVSDDKDFNISQVANRKWEIIKIELEKCDLLCANCHMINHSDKSSLEFLAEVKNYRGRLLG